MEKYYFDLDSAGVVVADEIDCGKTLTIEAVAMV